MALQRKKLLLEHMYSPLCLDEFRIIELEHWGNAARRQSTANRPPKSQGFAPQVELDPELLRRLSVSGPIPQSATSPGGRKPVAGSRSRVNCTRRPKANIDQTALLKRDDRGQKKGAENFQRPLEAQTSASQIDRINEEEELEEELEEEPESL
jgi:hypothetical protein